MNFRRHKVSVHQYSFRFEIKKIRFTCDTCGYEPTMNTPLKEHVYMIHSNVKHIDVTNVNMKVNFRRHKVSVHQYSFRFYCKECVKSVLDNGKFTRHKVSVPLTVLSFYFFSILTFGAGYPNTLSLWHYEENIK